MRFARARQGERRYGIDLRRIARHVGDLVRGMYDGNLDSLAAIGDALRRYAELLTPWAEATATRMVADAAQRDADAWTSYSRRFGKALKAEVERTPVEGIMRALVAEQVGLIRSLPLKAATRVQNLAIENVLGGRRHEEIVAMILDTHAVTRSRANLIARTETGRAHVALTQARAQHVGSESFVWHSARDRDVRPMHRQLEGTTHRWNDPPVAETNGARHLPGAYPNCRCWATPVIPYF